LPDHEKKAKHCAGNVSEIFFYLLPNVFRFLYDDTIKRTKYT